MTDHIGMIVTVWLAGAVLFGGIWAWWHWTPAPDPRRFDLLDPDRDVCQWRPVNHDVWTEDQL